MIRALLFICFLPIIAFASPPQFAELTPEQYNLLTTRDNFEIAIGSESAPVTIFDYSSFTCPHCGKFFSKSLPLLKEKYIDNGYVRFVHRDFPTDKVSFQASILLHCDQNVDKYALAKLLYNRQEHWATVSGYAEGLANLGEVIGITKSKYQSCLFDKKLESELLNRQLAPAKVLKINATPMLFINNKRYSGAHSFHTLSEVIDNELAKLNTSNKAVK